MSGLSFVCCPMKMRIAFFAVWCGLVLSGLSNFRYVNHLNDSPLPPYESWEDAATGIQDAVDASVDGDTVVVTNGTYTVTSPVTLNKAVTLCSVNGDEVTAIDGSGASRCLLISHTGAVVYGFTVRNGYNASTGGGIYISVAGGEIRDCRITGCRAQYGAGVMFAAGGGLLDRCHVVSNRADVSTAPQGGGVYIRTGVTMRNCLVTHNSAFIGGGVLSYQGGLAQGCTFSANHASSRGGGIYTYEGGTFRNCISFANTGTDPNVYNRSTYSFAYCCTLPVQSGTGNISSDPLFVNPAAGNYHLQYLSPSVNKGSNADAGGTVDLDGNPRIAYSTVDIGCYENLFIQFVDITTASASVPYDTVSYAVQGTNNIWVTGMMTVSNASNGASAVFAASTPWTTPTLPLAMGANNFVVTGTNAFGATSVDTVTITRLSPSITYVSLTGGNVPPYGSWQDAATGIQPAVNAVASGGTVWVADGTYVLPSPLNLSKAVTLRSVAGRDFTILNGNNSGRCLRISHPDVECRGFTIQNGMNIGSEGGGVYMPGGGTLRECRVTACRAGDGAGVYCGGSGVIDGCIIDNNEAVTVAFFYYDGGGVYLTSGGGILRNSLIVGNQAQNGGGVYALSGSLVTGCTLSANTASNRGGGLFFNNGGSCYNTITAFNTGTDADWAVLGSSAVFAYTCAPVAPPGTGNISADPLFAGHAGSDYHLDPGSPCFNAGNNALASGASDLDGQPRIIGGTVDMGCYEFAPAPFVAITTPPTSVPWDTTSFAVSGTNNTWAVGMVAVSNITSGAVAVFPVSSPWTTPLLDLTPGANLVVVTVTNVVGVSSVDDVVITRDPPPVTFVSPTGLNIPPYGSWRDAATTIQPAVDAVAVGGDVWITNGTYNLSSAVIIAKAVTVRSVNGFGSTFVSGQDACQCVQLADPDATLEGITLRNGSNSTGGGVYILPAGGTLRACHITACQADVGGGAYCDGSGVVDSCIIDHCVATAGLKSLGGGAYLKAGGILRNCLVVNNNADKGGGVYAYLGGLIQGCTLSVNRGAVQGGGIYLDQGGTCQNSVSAYNKGIDPEWFVDGGGAVFAYTCATPLPPGTGNIAADPQFVDRSAGDFHLLPASLCINAGSNTFVNNATDLDGHPRIMGGTVDMGCYEIAGDPLVTITTPSGSVPWDTVSFAAQGTNNIWVTGMMTVSNAANGASAVFAATVSWTTPALPLAMGTNLIEVCGTNALGVTATDSLSVTRLPPDTTYVSPAGRHIEPFGTWLDAATNIQSAVDAVASSGTVFIGSGTYVVSAPVNVDKTLTLHGVSGRDSTVVDAQYLCRCLEISGSGSCVAGITFTHGLSMDNAGGLLVEADGVTLISNRVSSCASAHDGGGLYCDCLSLGVYACEFLDNFSNSGAGGGVFLINGEGGIEQMTHSLDLPLSSASTAFGFYDCTFVNNRAAFDGGGAYLYGGYYSFCLVSNCLFQLNTAAGGAGGGFMAESPVALLNSRLWDNQSHFEGGGVYCGEGGSVRDSSFLRNTSLVGSGGGLSGGYPEPLIVDHCDFISNQSGFWGGGLYLIEGSVGHCRIQGNEAGHEGGGLYLSEGSVEHCRIQGNETGYDGGGLCLERVGVNNCTIEDNVADGGGGGIACRYLNIVVVDSRILRNHADYGGGVYGDFSLSLSNCLVAANSSVRFYGGVSSYRLDLYNCTVTANTAGEFVGGVMGADMLTVRNSIVTGNTPSNWEFGDTGGWNFSYCCTTLSEGGAGPGGTHNILTNDPHFVNPSVEDYHLASDSPCIDTGSNAFVSSPVDLDGRDRILNGTVDMGCYEFVPLPFIDITMTASAVPWDTEMFAVAGTNNAWVAGIMTVSNTTSGASGYFAATSPWTAPPVALAMGVNLIVVTGTNEVGAAASDSLVVTRQPPPVTYASPVGGHVEPFGSWLTAATNIQSAVDAVATNGTVWVTNGIYRLTTQIELIRPLSLRAFETWCAILDCGNQTRGFDIGHADVLLDGFTVFNGRDPWEGGGIRVGVPGATVSRCYAIMCAAAFGGGFYFADAGGNAEYCLAVNCDAAVAGGGFYLQEGVSCDRCFVENNTAGYFGGGAYCDYGGTFVNSLFAFNESSYQGGAVYLDGGGLLGNCTVVSNRADLAGGGIYGKHGGQVVNTIVFANEASSGMNWLADGSGLSFSHSCAVPLPAGAGNIDGDPLFADPSFDFSLTAGSPAVNTGDDDWLFGPVDLAGVPRVLGGRVDMGAFEYAGAPVIEITTPAGSVPCSTATIALTGSNNIWVANAIVSNQTTGVWSTVPQESPWTAQPLPLVIGANLLVAYGWSGDGAVATDTITITRQPPAVTYVSLTGRNIAPYATWADAAVSIQDAVNAVAAGGLTIVSNGTYRLRGAVVVPAGNAVRSLAGRDVTVADGDATVHCFTLMDSARLEDITCRNGYGLNQGGGIVVMGEDAVITGCRITGCEAAGTGYGGAIESHADYVTISGCTIDGNTAAKSGGGVVLSGGGLIDGCSITQNTADETGGGVYLRNGVVNASLIAGNRADAMGGGLHLVGGGMVTRCTVRNNDSESRGGGIAMDFGGAVINSLLYENSAYTQGGGVYCLNGGDVINSTICWNSADDGGGAYTESCGTFRNTILYYNTALSYPSYANLRRTYGGTFEYCCSVNIKPAGTGNFSDSPSFVSPGPPEHNYRLQYGSPCIDTGDDTGVTGDIEGNPRPLDGNGDLVPAYDIGAYEYNPATADSNQDGIPDWWYLLYGLNPSLVGVAGGNPDLDVHTTGQEWVADTSPTNGNDFLRITLFSAGVPENGIKIDNSSVNRLYTLQWRESLDTGTWQDVSGQIRMPGTGGVLSFTHGASGPSAFYRVVVELPDPR